jgi:hypothetical protein
MSASPAPIPSARPGRDAEASAGTGAGEKAHTSGDGPLAAAETEPADAVEAEDPALFADELARLEATIGVPYPARADVIEEMAADLLAAYREERARGHGREVARARALDRLGLNEEGRSALEGVHAPAPLRLLARLPATLRSWLHAVATATPLALLVVFLMVEIPVNEVLRNGGPVVTMILAFGSLGLLLEMQRFFIWFVLRDHSPEALRRNTATPLYLAAATVLLGLLGTSFRYYRFLGRLPEDLASLRIGLREPLTSLIMACSLAALTVLLHGALTAGLRALKVPDRV